MHLGHRRFVVHNKSCCIELAQRILYSTCCVTSLHNTHDVSRASWRACRACVSCRAYSNIDNDEAAVVLTYTSCFCVFSICIKSQEQRVVRVASIAHVVKSMSRRAIWQAQHTTSRLFSCVKIPWQNNVSCRDTTSGIWATHSLLS